MHLKQSEVVTSAPKIFFFFCNLSQIKLFVFTKQQFPVEKCNHLVLAQV